MPDALDELEAKYANQGQGQPQTTAPNSGGDALDQLSAKYEQQSKQSTVMDMVDGFNNSVSKLANGALQPMMAVLDKTGITNTASQRLKNVEEQSQRSADAAAVRSPYATATGSIIGDLAKVGYTSALTGGLGFGGYGAGTATARMGQQGLLAATGAGAEYGDINTRLNNAGTAGAFGVAGQALLGEALPMAYRAAKEGAGSLANKYLFTGNTPQEAASAINAGQKMTAGMATGNEAIKSTEGYLAQVPIVGTKGNMGAVADDLTTQAKDLLQEKGLSVGEKEIEASMGQQANALKNEVKIAEKQARTQASAEYQKFRDMSGATPIPMVRAGEIADEALNPQAVKEGYTAADISGGKMGEIIKNISGMKQASASTLETIRQDIGSFIKDIRNGRGDSRLLPTLTKLKGGLDDDLTAFSEAQGGAVESQLKKARGTYQELVAPFKEEGSVLRDIAKGKLSPDTLVKRAIKDNNPDSAMKLMNNLTPNGKEIYTKSLLLGAAKDSFKDGSREFSAQKFGKQLFDMGETLKALPPEILAKVNGLKTAISEADHVFNALKGKGVWEKGAATALAGTAGVAGGAGALIGGATGVKAISYLLTNPKMVKQLVRLGGGDLPPNVHSNTIKYILKTLGATFKAGQTATAVDKGKEKAPK